MNDQNTKELNLLPCPFCGKAPDSDYDNWILVLEHQSDIETAKLSVAEDMAGLIALFAAFIAYLIWKNWLFSILIYIGFIFLIIYSYRRNANAADNAYFKAAGLGKYAPKE